MKKQRTDKKIMLEEGDEIVVKVSPVETSIDTGYVQSNFADVEETEKQKTANSQIEKQEEFEEVKNVSTVETEIPESEEKIETESVIETGPERIEVEENSVDSDLTADDEKIIEELPLAEIDETKGSVESSYSTEEMVAPQIPPQSFIPTDQTNENYQTVDTPVEQSMEALEQSNQYSEMPVNMSQDYVNPAYEQNVYEQNYDQFQNTQSNMMPAEGINQEALTSEITSDIQEDLESLGIDRQSSKEASSSSTKWVMGCILTLFLGFLGLLVVTILWIFQIF